MLNEESLTAVAIAAWKSNLERTIELFGGLDQSALEKQVAPGRNRLVNVWGSFGIGSRQDAPVARDCGTGTSGVLCNLPDFIGRSVDVATNR